MTDDTKVRTPETRCPVCDNPNDAVTSTSPGVRREPKPGDFGLCIGCGTVLEFNADLRAFVPDPEHVLAEMAKDARLAMTILAAQQAIFATNKKHHN